MKQKVSMPGMGRYVWLLAALLLPLAGAHGQTQPGFDETEAERQKRLLEEQRHAGSASQEVLPAEKDITYADVLKDPDNVDLNFRYAKAQIARGNVRGAAATLERILLVTPDLPQIRLMYAIVLYRLDNTEEAEREFKALKKLKMAPSLEAQIDRFLKAIERRRQVVTAHVTASIGVKRDSNITAGPRDGVALAVGIPFSPVGTGQKKRDYGLVGFVSGELRRDLGHQTRDEFFMGGSYYHDEQFIIGTQDLQAGTVDMGFKLLYPNFTMTPKLTFTDLALSDEKFYDSLAAEMRFDRRKVLPFFGGIDGYFRLSAATEHFHAIEENSLGPERNGTLWEAETGLVKRITPNHRVTGAFTFIRKLPYEKSFNGYRGYKVSLRHTWLLGGGNFLLTGLDVTSNLYRDPDNSVTPFQTRHDTQVRFRITYGMPLSNVFSESLFGAGSGKKYYDFLKDFTWTVTGEILDQSSNIPNFDYQNRRAQTMLTRTWNF